MSKKILTKDEVLKLVRTAKGEFVRLLSQTAYDAMARLDEMKERQALFAEAVKDQVNADELRDEIQRLREQLEEKHEGRPLVAVLVYRNGQVLVCGKKEQVDVCVSLVPDLPDSMAAEREAVLVRQLKALHREAFACGELAVIGRANTNAAMSLYAYRYLKAYKLITRLTKENELLKMAFKEPEK